MVVQQPQEQPQRQTLAQLAARIAERYPGFSLYHAKLFSIVVPDIGQVHSLVQQVEFPAAAVPNRHPVIIAIGDFSEACQFTTTLVPSVANGVLQINSEVINRRLPHCQYLALISPIEAQPPNTDYSKAYAAIGFVRSLLALNFGKLVQYTFVADFDFGADGAMHFGTPIFRMPLYGDLLRFLDPVITSEIVSRLPLQQEGYRQRLQRACDFVNYALNQADESFRFSAYWIALEILVAGKSNTIRDKLGAAYGEGRGFIDGSLRFNEISRARHALMHHGDFGILPAYHERLLHLYFWDIVRHQLGLPCRRLAQVLAQSGLIETETSEGRLEATARGAIRVAPATAVDATNVER